MQAALMDRSKGKGDNDDDDDDQEGSETAYTLTQGTLEKHLRLDSAAASAVMLLPDPSNPHQYGSLYNVLNRCVRLALLEILCPRHLLLPGAAGPRSPVFVLTKTITS